MALLTCSDQWCIYLKDASRFILHYTFITHVEWQQSDAKVTALVLEQEIKISKTKGDEMLKVTDDTVNCFLTSTKKVTWIFYGIF